MIHHVSKLKYVKVNLVVQAPVCQVVHRILIVLQQISVKQTQEIHLTIVIFAIQIKIALQKVVIQTVEFVNHVALNL